MKALADEMASAGRKLEDDEFVSYILTGLDLYYDGVAFVVAARVEPISIEELFTQLTSFEQCMEWRGGANNPSVNKAAKGSREGNNSNNPRGRSGGGRNGFGRGIQ
jgi:hypothetical protein